MRANEIVRTLQRRHRAGAAHADQVATLSIIAHPERADQMRREAGAHVPCTRGDHDEIDVARNDAGVLQTPIGRGA